MVTKNYSQQIKQLREKHDLSQEYLAKKINVSRPTYSQLEKGNKDLTISQAEALARIFNISLSDLFNENDPENIDVVLSKEKSKRLVSKKKSDTRIILSEANVKKFQEVLLYVLNRVGAKPNIGETALYKLLYFIDFDFYEKYEDQLIGAQYIKNHFGPTPVEFEKVVKEMESKGEIERVKSSFFRYEQKKYLPRRDPELKTLTAEELAHIDWELDRLGDMTASQLSALSHIDTPWKVAKDRDALEYEHVFYRPEETSVREYEEI